MKQQLTLRSVLDSRLVMVINPIMRLTVFVLLLCGANHVAIAQTSGYIYTKAGNGVNAYSGDGGAATSAEIGFSYGVVADGSDNFYIADTNHHRVRKVTASNGIITTIAGNGTQGYSGDGGAATSAELNTPEGLALDSSGNLYIADAGNNRIRRVDTTGVITTVAGNGTQGYSGDGGAATSAELYGPNCVAVDPSGNLFIGDGYNERVRVVNTSGVIFTYAGNGTFGFSGDGGAATSAQLAYAAGLATDASGNLYIGDSSNSRVRKVTASTGIITTVAGNGSYGYSGDGGAATSAAMRLVSGVTLDSAGNLYIADGNSTVRLVTASTGIISTYAGTGTSGYSGDGGPATSAQLSVLLGQGLSFPGSHLFIADSENSRVRWVY